ncbi:MAG: hypothetical protein M3O15_09470 [Acidobacteriota bacterium]|nr:hypothetical protein [Acidobacteriota bacterium]
MVRAEIDGHLMAFTPTVEDTSGLQVRVRAYTIRAIDGNHEAVQQVGAFDLEAGRIAGVQGVDGATAMLHRVYGPLQALRVVRWELLVDDGASASFESREGEMSQFRHRPKGIALGFIPRFDDQDNGVVHFAVFDLDRSPGKSVQPDSLVIAAGKDYEMPGIAGLRLRVTGVEVAPASGQPDACLLSTSADGATRGIALRPVKSCCTACAGQRTCGCAVDTICGTSCCDSPCCAFGGKPVQ